MAKPTQVAGYVVSGDRSLQIMPLTTEGKALVGDGGDLGTPTWPVPTNTRPLVRRTSRGIKVTPYALLSTLVLGYPALPGRSAFVPDQTIVSEAMSERISRAAITKPEKGGGSGVITAWAVVALVLILLVAVVAGFGSELAGLLPKSE